MTEETYVPIAAIENRDIDEVDVSGWGVYNGHAIPMSVGRAIAKNINLYHKHRLAFASETKQVEKATIANEGSTSNPVLLIPQSRLVAFLAELAEEVGLGDRSIQALQATMLNGDTCLVTVDEMSFMVSNIPDSKGK